MKTCVLILISLMLLAIAQVLAQPYDLASVNWIKYLKLTDGNDRPFGTCIFGDYLAVVGRADMHPALVLFDTGTGGVVRKWVSNKYGWFTSCFPIGDVLYVAGWENGGVIYTFDKSLNVLNRAESSLGLVFNSITYDGEYLYFGGTVYTDINGDGKQEATWYIEKRTKSLNIINYKQYNRGLEGFLYNVGINPATGELWAVGYYNETSPSTSLSLTHPFIVIFDKELRGLKEIDYGRETYPSEYYHKVYDICFDSAGNAYAGRLGEVRKYDKNGNLIKINNNIGAVRIICAYGLVYAFNLETLDGYLKHVLYVLDSELNMIERYVLSKNVDADSSFTQAGRSYFDGRNIYVAGLDEALGQDRKRWVVYSIAVKPLPPITVAIEGLPQSYSIPVYVNGVFSGYVQGGGSRAFNVSEVKVTVKVGLSKVETKDTVYEVASDTLTVSPGEKAVFRYSAKFYVSVAATPPEASRGVSGSGWYREGSVATLRANETIQVSDYERLRFLGWSTGETSGLITRTVSSPLSVEARYEWEYRVEVRSELGVAFGSGWYRRGDEARVGLEGLREGYYYASDEKVRYRFEGWGVRRGDMSTPEASSFSFSVSGPVVVEARFGPPEYLVCIDSACSYYREGYTIPPGQDVPELGGLLIRRFEGYTDPNGNSLGKSFTVTGPVQATSAYREEVNLPLLAVILTIVLVTFVIASRLKVRKGAEIKVKGLESGKGAWEQGMRETDVENEIAILEERLARLDELYQRGEIEEEIYQRLKEEYENKKEMLRRLKTT